MSLEQIAKPIDASRNASDQGVIAKTHGVAILDQVFTQTDDTVPQLSTTLHIGTGGTVVFEGPDGKPGVYIGVSNDRLLGVVASRILTSATVNGTLYATTAADITWHGGQ